VTARVRQILFALVANAVAATARGRIDIEAELDGLDGDRATLWFCVRDTGGGVKPDLAPHIFEPFVQGARDPNTPSSGLGLGLAVARETAEALGIKVRFDERLAPGASGAAVLEVAGWREKESDGKSRHVLIVGHQPALGEALSLTLSGEVQRWTVRKGALVWLASRNANGESQVYLRASIGPDLV